jgi:hypothetical protein
VHCVDVDFGEQRCRSGDDWGNKDLSSLTKLTEVTGIDEPVNIGLNMGPPETFADMGTSRIETFVTYEVMTVTKYFETFRHVNDDFVSSLRVFAP